MKYTLMIVTIALSILASFSASAKPGKVLMMISEGFWAPEYYTPRTLFNKQGFEIKVAAKYLGLVKPDKRNTKYKPVKADLTFDQVNIDEYDAVVFAGGNGAWEDFFPNETVHKILGDAMEKDLVVALLCSSTGLLGVARNLDGAGNPLAVGRKVTGYKRVVALLKNLGKVDYYAGEKGKPYVVIDKKLITGRDPISSELFGKSVVKVLNSALKGNK